MQLQPAWSSFTSKKRWIEGWNHPTVSTQTLVLTYVHFSSKSNAWKIANLGTYIEAISRRFKTTRYSRDTPNYRVPQLLIESASYNKKVNIWVMRCVLYECCIEPKAFDDNWAVHEYSTTRSLKLSGCWFFIISQIDKRFGKSERFLSISGQLIAMLSIQSSDISVSLIHLKEIDEALEQRCIKTLFRIGRRCMYYHLQPMRYVYPQSKRCMSRRIFSLGEYYIICPAKRTVEKLR